MTMTWCEHDDVAAVCPVCRLHLAEATTELLTIRLQRARELLERAANTVTENAPVGTHWDGCADSHPFCALVRDIRNLLQGEDNDESQVVSGM